jgi:hypothetical protein
VLLGAAWAADEKLIKLVNTKRRGVKTRAAAVLVFIYPVSLFLVDCFARPYGQ